MSGWDESYGTKQGTPTLSWTSHVTMSMHGGVPSGPDAQRKMIYIRTAFRNEADFTIGSFNRLASPLESPRVSRLIDTDMSVSENYQRLVMQTIDGIYDPSIPDTATKGEIRDRIIGDVRRAMLRVFPDLILTGVGGLGSAAASQGTFYFTKGSSENFLYKNLSAGEKAAFDLILDAVVKREYYDDTIWCIDEPESHLNTRIQGLLLETLVELLPPACQLFVASHSIGFMRKAWEMARSHPGSVAFLNMQGVDFDQPAILAPIQPSREFWAEILDVAFGDLAHLVAPEQLVLCEGKPLQGKNRQKAAFDSYCYTRIFASEYPQVDFLSVGNSADVGEDRLEFGAAVKTLTAGTRLTRLIDRDLRNADEVAEAKATGLRVLSRRNIEAYLLDDEVLSALCMSVGQPDKVGEALAVKQQCMQGAVGKGADADDWKAPAGRIYVELRRLLGLTGAGQTWDGFARGTLAPLITPAMSTYDELKTDIFGE